MLIRQDKKKILLICCPGATIKITSNFLRLSSASLRCSHSPSPSSRGPSGMATFRLICCPNVQVRCERGSRVEETRRVSMHNLVSLRSSWSLCPRVLYVHSRAFPLVSKSCQLCYIWQQFEAFQLGSVKLFRAVPLLLSLENISSPSCPTSPVAVRLTRSSTERLRAGVGRCSSSSLPASCQQTSLNLQMNQQKSPQLASSANSCLFPNINHPFTRKHEAPNH